MKHIKNALPTMLLLSVLFSLVCSLSSCGSGTEKPAEPKTHVIYGYFDTAGIITDYSGGTDAEFSELAELVERELSEYHRLYDIYNEYSGINNLATLNKNAGKGKIKVDKKIIDMLLYAKEMYTLTDGHMNVAMGAVLKIWHDHREDGTSIPEMSELRDAAEHTDIDDLIIDKEGSTVELRDESMRIDVGALGKGYAVEMIAKMLHGAGYSRILLNIGGNLRAIGEKAEGTPFKVGIRNPLAETGASPYAAYISLSDSAAVTSGSYERFYTVDGKEYHHIISKDTLMPENIHLSVTVHTESSALADALSTAFFNMTADEIQSVLDGTDIDIRVTVLSPSGAVSELRG